MSLFRVKDREFKKLATSAWPAHLFGLLTERLANGNGLLPERLLMIDTWDAPEGAAGLLALDAKGSLVVMLLAGGEPSGHAIREAASFAWRLRHVAYGELADACAKYHAQHGRTFGELAGFHADYFSLETALDAGLFNQNQRVVVVAPEYSEATLAAMRWRRLEMQLDAFSLLFIDIESDVSLVRIEPVDLVGGGRVTTFLSLALRAPAALVERLAPGEFRGESAIGEPIETGDRRPDEAPGQVPAASSKTFEYSALAAMVLLYIAAFSYLTVRLHNNFQTFGFDLGIFDQGIWLLSRLKDPFITVRGLHLFGDHLSFMLVLLAPLYKIWADVRLLLVLQTIALALGAVPVYLLAKDRLRHGVLALALAASYLLYPALQWLNRDHFHPETIATPALLFAFYFVMRRRYGLFAVAALIALLAKEDIALILMLMGVYIAVTNNRAVGLATTLASLAWFLIGIKFILPMFNQEGFFYIRNYSNLGSTPGEVIVNTITKPGLALSLLLQERKLVYLTQLLAPVAFSPFASIEVFLIALPALFSNLTSQQGYMDTIEYHYTATIIPFVFVSAILAIEKLSLKKREGALVAALILLIALTSNYFWGPLPGSQKYRQGFFVSDNGGRASAQAGIALIPENASVSAFYAFVPHLTHRERIYEFPNPYISRNWGIRDENPADTDSIDFIIVDYGKLPDDQRAVIDELRNTEFSQIYNKDGVVVLRRD